MRIVAISDLHGYLPEIEPADLLLIGGDVCPVDNHYRQFQAKWLRSAFSDWLRSLPVNHIVGIGGNHDFVLQDSKLLGYELPWIYLKHEFAHVDGLKIFGSPYAKRFGDWAFMKPDNELIELWDLIPRDVDILVVHGPAYGIGDLVGGVIFDTATQDWLPEHLGSRTLRNQLVYEEWPNLKLFVFGHIHGGYGRVDTDKWIEVNVSQMNEEYLPHNKPFVFEMENNEIR